MLPSMPCALAVPTSACCGLTLKGMWHCLLLPQSLKKHPITPTKVQSDLNEPPSCSALLFPRLLLVSLTLVAPALNIGWTRVPTRPSSMTCTTLRWLLASTLAFTPVPLNGAASWVPGLVVVIVLCGMPTVRRTDLEFVSDFFLELILTTCLAL